MSDIPDSQPYRWVTPTPFSWGRVLRVVLIAWILFCTLPIWVLVAGAGYLHLWLTNPRRTAADRELASPVPEPLLDQRPA
jgi:hypothetical protein